MLQIDGVDILHHLLPATPGGRFEISVPAARGANAGPLLLIAQRRCCPVGLGARDSLRLEAGLCLYGHELTVDIDPVQAGLMWSISKARRPDGARAGRRLSGAEVIFQRMVAGAPLRRVGLAVAGKTPRA